MCARRCGRGSGYVAIELLRCAGGTGRHGYEAVGLWVKGKVRFLGNGLFPAVHIRRF